MAHKTSRSADLTTPVIRGAYFFIHEKRTKDGNKNLIPADKQKYEFVGLIPKTHTDPMQCPNYRLFADLAMGAVAAQTTEWGGQFPAGGNWPIKDGDLKAAKNPWMAGQWVIKFSTNFPPKVAVLQNGQITEIPARRVGIQDLYKSGDYCNVSTYAYSYDNQTRGVAFDLQGVLFVRPGDAIGAASRSVGDMFGSVAPVSGGVLGGALPLPGAPTAPSATAGLAPIGTGYAAHPSSPPQAVQTMPPQFPGQLNPPMPPMPPSVGMPPLPIPGR